MALVVKSAVRSALKGMRSSGDFFKALDKHLAEELSKRCDKARLAGISERLQTSPEELIFRVLRSKEEWINLVENARQETFTLAANGYAKSGDIKINRNHLVNPPQDIVKTLAGILAQSNPLMTTDASLAADLTRRFTAKDIVWSALYHKIDDQTKQKIIELKIPGLEFALELQSIAQKLIGAPSRYWSHL